MGKNYEKWSSNCGRVTLYRGDCLDVMPSLEQDSIDSVISDPPYGLKFMGKKWDHGVPGVPFWEAARRVMKPGAMLMAFGGSRTFHRLACAIEDAGLEIRDCIMWLYGSGFPKSHDISVAIDGIAPGPTASFPGYGTALKPAYEPITLAMKPLDGTFAANALAHGVAGLNIDGGRIGNEARESGMMSYSSCPTGTFAGESGKITRKGVKTVTGRWPANVLLDESAAAELDAQSGHLKGPGKYKKPSYPIKSKTFGVGDGNIAERIFQDSGGASRFFYCSKASKSERNAGLEGMPIKKTAPDCRPNDSGEDGMSSRMHGATTRGENHHPTCKPIKLLRYLARLTKTPTGGIVLDPFMGSGSMGVAAVAEGREFVGIEKEPEYFEIAKRRITHALAESQADLFAGMEIK
jgi:DNA modification methylase